MKIIHTADIHLGQTLYQSYDRADEHNHFFSQLEQWCRRESPDALIVSGDLYDIQQPSVATRRAFNEHFAALHRACPSMKIVITAGNHDSASRIQADRPLWEFAGVTAVGTGPAADGTGDNISDLHDDYIVRLPSGYIVAVPFLTGQRTATLQGILDRIAAENTGEKPVVMTAHAAVDGLDATGHDFEVGKIKTCSLNSLGKGYDYLALGHIHKPQTLGHQEDCFATEATYASPVARYSGSPLHVSCDETFPHTVSLVEIDRHGGNVNVRQLKVDQLRHFTTLSDGGRPFTDAGAALLAIKDFAESGGQGYFRLSMNSMASLPSNFSQLVYDIIAPSGDNLRYNPKILWCGAESQPADESGLKFEVAELQQMTDPLAFVERTIDRYPGLDIDMLRDAFSEVNAELRRMADEDKTKADKKRKA